MITFELSPEHVAIAGLAMMIAAAMLYVLKWRR
jgi:hypothetical protein